MKRTILTTSAGLLLVTALGCGGSGGGSGGSTAAQVLAAPINALTGPQQPTNAKPKVGTLSDEDAKAYSWNEKDGSTHKTGLVPKDQESNYTWPDRR